MQFKDSSSRDVALNLDRVETMIDDTIIECITLIGSIIDARRRNGLPYGVAQGPLSDLIDAMKLTIQARHHVCRSHARLLEAGETAGLVARPHGDTQTYTEARDVDQSAKIPIAA